MRMDIQAAKPASVVTRVKIEERFEPSLFVRARWAINYRRRRLDRRLKPER